MHEAESPIVSNVWGHWPVCTARRLYRVRQKVALWFLSISQKRVDFNTKFYTFIQRFHLREYKPNKISLTSTLAKLQFFSMTTWRFSHNEKYMHCWSQSNLTWHRNVEGNTFNKHAQFCIEILTRFWKIGKTGEGLFLPQSVDYHCWYGCRQTCSVYMFW